MAVPAFAFAAGALAAAAFLCAATLRLRGTSFAVGAYLFAWAGAVGLPEVLSIFGAVSRLGYVIGSAGLLLVAAGVWQLKGRSLPDLRRPRLGPLRAHPQLVALGAVVLGGIAYQAFLVVAAPPNNYDSLTYHLPRVVAWLQQGHIGYFDAATQRANAFPGAAELGILYTVALLGRDTLAALPQLMAELAVLVCVFGTARRLGFGRPAALFAALLTATLSEIALQSVTTQNDLVVASFVAAAVYFVLADELPLAGLAVGLAVGTKLTGLLALPLVVVLALAVVPRRRLAVLAASAVAGFACFGAFWYGENAIRTHHPLGVVPEADPYRPEHTLGGAVSTAARVSWRFVDFTGLEPPGDLVAGLGNTGSRLFALAHIDPNPPEATAGRFGFPPAAIASEDLSYFGVLGFLLLVPLCAGFLVASLGGRASRARGAIAAALPLFILAIALTQSYNHWLGRFMVIPVAVTMPLTAWLYDRRLRLLSLIAVVAGAATLVGTHQHNLSKPHGVWSMTRANAQTLNAGGVRCASSLVDATVPANARLGVVLGNNDPSYVLYGPRLQRRLVLLRSSDPLRTASARGLRWIVVSPGKGLLVAEKRWHAQIVRGGWQLLTSSAPQAPVPRACAPSARLLAAGRGERDATRSRRPG